MNSRTVNFALWLVASSLALVYGGGPGHVVRIDDAKVMVDDAVGAEASAWGNLKALYR